MDDTDLSLASAEEQGQQGAAEGHAFQPQQLFQEGQLAADRRAQMMPRPGGFGGGVGGMPTMFTQADSIRLQQLQQGMSQAQRQVDSGELTPQEGQQYQQMIGGMMGPLAQKQQIAQGQMQQRAIGQAMHQSALDATIRLQNMKHMAEGYPSTIIRDTHPLTGDQVEYHQDGTGKIVQTDMRKSERPTRVKMMEGMSGGADTPFSQPGTPVPPQAENFLPGFQPGMSPVRYDPESMADRISERDLGLAPPLENRLAPTPTRPTSTRLPSGETQTPEPPLADEPKTGTPMAAQAAPPQQQANQFSEGTGDEAMGGGPAANLQQSASPDNRHVMTIWNGDHMQKFAFNPDGTMQNVYDSRPSMTEAGQSGVDESDMNYLLRDAAKSLADNGIVEPQWRGGGPRAMQQFALAHRAWQAEVMRWANNNANRLSADRRNKYNWEQRVNMKGSEFDQQEKMLGLKGEQAKQAREEKAALKDDYWKARAQVNKEQPNLQGKDLESAVEAAMAHNEKVLGARQPAGVPVPGQAPPGQVGQWGSQFIGELGGGR